MAKVPVDTVSYVSYLRNLRFNHLNTSGGLSFNDIFDIAADNQGFVWISTRDGLNRFDGTSVKVYKHVAGNPQSLLGNYLSNILIDHLGVLWVCTERGLCRYNANNDSFNSINDPYTTALDEAKQFAQSVYEDSKNKLWYGNYLGLCEYDRLSQQVHFYKLYNNDNERHAIASIKDDSFGHLWLGDEKGLICFDKTKHTFKRYTFIRPGKLSERIGDNVITRIYVDSHSRWWIGTWGSGLHTFDPVHRKYLDWFMYEKKPLQERASNIVLDIMEYRSEATGDTLLWAGCGSQGLAIVDKTTQTFHFTHHDNSKPYSLSSDYVKKIFRIKPGIVLVGTLNGVDIIDEFTNFIHHTELKLQKGTGLYRPIVSIIQDAKNTNIIWTVHSDYGLIRWDIKSNICSTYSFRHFISMAVKYDEKTIWLATLNGVIAFDTRTGKYNPVNFSYKNSMNERLPLQLSYLYIDKHKRVWFGTWGNDICYLENNKLQHIRLLNKEKTAVNNIIEDSTGNIWLATKHTGLVMIDKTSKTHNFIFKNNEGITLARCQDICFKSGYIWIATPEGLVQFEPLTHKYSVLTTFDGLNNNTIYRLAISANNHVWLSTRNGLSEYNPYKKRFRNYFALNGLFIDNLDLSNSLTYISGKGIFIGYDDNVDFFDPNAILHDSLPPPIRFVSVKVFDKELLPSRYNNTPLVLSYKDNVLHIYFSGLNYINPSLNIYSCKMEGFDNQWQNIGTRKEATYTNLNGGNYIFKVRSANNNGVWNYAGITLNIRICPPFWKTWWFNILCILFIAISTGLILRQRISVIQKQNNLALQLKEKEFRITESELKALRAQMNPHFIFNCMNTIESYVMKNETEKASIFIQSFSKLIRLVLENSQYKTVKINYDINALKLYIRLEQLRFDNQFDVIYNIDEEVLNSGYTIPPLIIQPYVENAILHGFRHSDKRGLLKITYKIIDNAIDCIVEDNGIGRQKARYLKEQNHNPHHSMGTQVTEDRIKTFNQSSEIKSAVIIEDMYNELGESTGTKVTLSMPINL